MSETKIKNKKMDMSLISYSFKYVSDLRENYKLDMIMRFQTFKEMEIFSDLISSTSSVSMADRHKKLRECLVNMLMKPSKKIFIEWLDGMYEPELADFITKLAQAKGDARKK